MLKECPKCHRWQADTVWTCDCGHEFPVRGRTDLYEDFRYARGCVGWVVVHISLVGLILSFIFIFSALSNTRIWWSERCSYTMNYPQEHLYSLITGLLVGGAACYAIITTKYYWSDIPLGKKLIIILSTIADIVLVMLVLFVNALSRLCE